MLTTSRLPLEADRIAAHGDRDPAMPPGETRIQLQQVFHGSGLLRASLARPATLVNAQDWSISTIPPRGLIEHRVSRENGDAAVPMARHQPVVR
jgi:hypothetical protein